jgi:hypothetical protein
MLIQVIFFQIICQVFGLKYESWCDTWSSKHLFNSTEYHIVNVSFVFVKVDDESDLNFGKEKCSIRDNAKSIEYIKIYPTQMILFGNDIDFDNGVLRLFRFDYFGKDTTKGIVFMNVKGFTQRQMINSQQSNSINTLNVENHRKSFIIISLRNAYVEFYLNTKLITESECNEQNFPSNMTSYFRYFY